MVGLLNHDQPYPPPMVVIIVIVMVMATGARRRAAPVAAASVWNGRHVNIIGSLATPVWRNLPRKEARECLK